MYNMRQDFKRAEYRITYWQSKAELYVDMCSESTVLLCSSTSEYEV
jgi:hypothetical protein